LKVESYNVLHEDALRNASKKQITGLHWGKIKLKVISIEIDFLIFDCLYAVLCYITARLKIVMRRMSTSQDTLTA